MFFNIFLHSVIAIFAVVIIGQIISSMVGGKEN